MCFPFAVDHLVSSPESLVLSGPHPMGFTSLAATNFKKVDGPHTVYNSFICVNLSSDFQAFPPVSSRGLPLNSDFRMFRSCGGVVGCMNIQLFVISTELDNVATGSCNKCSSTLWTILVGIGLPLSIPDLLNGPLSSIKRRAKS
jgi:hypothetical protein